MEEQILDASSIDEFDELDLMGDYGDEWDSPRELIPAPQNNEPEPPSLEEPEETPGPQIEEEDDFTTEVLRLKGISDPSKIKFEDESGAIVERDWNDLSRNEQLTILTQEGDPETDLEDDEINFINMLRSNGITAELYIQTIRQQTINEVHQQIQDSLTPVYEIDSLSDDELYALDLMEKVGEDNITDEELQQALSNAKQNEELYAKQINALRVQYKNLEDSRRYQIQQEEQAQAEAQYQHFSNQVLNEIQGFNLIAGEEIELSTDDMNDLANFMLTRDENGLTDFNKALYDPKTFTTVAFWALKGPEIMLELMQEMQQLKQEAYMRGYNMAKADRETNHTPNKPAVVIKPQTSSNESVNNINELDLEDESYLYN